MGVDGDDKRGCGVCGQSVVQQQQAAEVQVEGPHLPPTSTCLGWRQWHGSEPQGLACAGEAA